MARCGAAFPWAAGSDGNAAAEADAAADAAADEDGDDDNFAASMAARAIIDPPKSDPGAAGSSLALAGDSLICLCMSCRPPRIVDDVPDSPLGPWPLAAGFKSPVLVVATLSSILSAVPPAVTSERI